MDKNFLKIEIANVCAQINFEENYLFNFLRKKFKDFISKNKIDFTIDIQAKLRHKKTSLELKDSDWDILDNIKTLKENNQIHILTQLPASRELGFIDFKRNRCQFNPQPQILQQYLFSPFLRFCFQVFLFKMGGFMLHASAVSQNSISYLFTGPAGSGKSTAASNLSPHLKVLSDELVAIRKRNGHYYIYSTPWTEKKRKTSRLDKIFFPKKAKNMSFEKVAHPQAVLNIYANTLYHVLDYSLANKLLDNTVDLATHIPSYNMYFNLDSPILSGIKDID